MDPVAGGWRFVVGRDEQNRECLWAGAVVGMGAGVGAQDQLMTVQRWSAGVDDGGRSGGAHRDGGGGHRELMAAIGVGASRQQQGPPVSDGEDIVGLEVQLVHSENIGNADELGADPGGGVAENLASATLLDEYAVGHHHQVVGEVQDVFAVVGHDDEADAGAFVQAPDQGAKFAADGGVQVGEGFIKQQGTRSAGQCAGHGDALAFPAGKAGGVSVAQVGELDRDEEFA